MRPRLKPNARKKIPANAVLLIPEPENENDAPMYGVKAGYYNSKQMVDLIDQHKGNADAIHYIADMLETGDAESDGFAVMLRGNCRDPQAIARIVGICKE
jgi:hypothetical protein